MKRPLFFSLLILIISIKMGSKVVVNDGPINSEIRGHVYLCYIWYPSIIEPKWSWVNSYDCLETTWDLEEAR